MDDTKLECHVCKGDRGWDVSTDCEVYDQWVDCQNCDGSGEEDE